MNNNSDGKDKFINAFSGSVADKIKCKEMLNQHIFFKIGGEADYFVEPESIEELVAILNVCHKTSTDRYVIGNGTNILVSDKGFRGIVIKIGDKFSEVKIKGNRVEVGAGALLSSVSKMTAERGLKGLDFACGIPGYIGGAVAMNAGAYNGEIKDTLISVKCMDKNGNICSFTNEEMNFGYRTSKVFEDDLIVLSAEFQLEIGDAEEILDRISYLNAKRTASQPLELPSAGSTFKRPVGGYASKLIQDAGLKGYKVGGAMVSDKHSGFVVNFNHATCADVLQLIKEVEDIVDSKFGILLEPEVKIIGEF